jgi:Mg/Co/Ni transporter MgtE
MKLLLLVVVIIILFGPLRPWVGRHWAFLISVAGGAIAGFVIGAILTGFGAPVFTPLLGAIVFAVECGQLGPAWFREIEKDGKK